MLYASTSRALACLETVVHLARRPLPLNRYLVRLSVPAAAWAAAAEADPAALVGWDAEPAGKVSLDWGTGWAHGAKTLLARVPSAIVAGGVQRPRQPDAPRRRRREGRQGAPLAVRRAAADDSALNRTAASTAAVSAPPPPRVATAPALPGAAGSIRRRSR